MLGPKLSPSNIVTCKFQSICIKNSAEKFKSKIETAIKIKVVKKVVKFLKPNLNI